jgi:hypothetical protein
MKIIVLTLFILILIVCLSGLVNVKLSISRFGGGPCSDHCFSNSSLTQLGADELQTEHIPNILGQYTTKHHKQVPMDVYNCCQCQAQYPSHYGFNNLSQCLCHQGYRNFCFNIENNMLLPSY